MPGSQDFAADPRNASLKVWLNGQLVPKDEAKVSIFDAGFVLGDGVWEGLRLHKGALLFLDAHLDRLYAGAKDIALDLGLSRDEMVAALRATLDANGMHHGAHLRLMATRGVKAAVNQDPRNALGAATIVIVAEYKEPSPDIVTKGLAVATSSIRCTPADMFDMRLNSHSRLALIRALLDVIPKGGDEALMLDPGGFVSSCNATNFFWVRDGEVRTSTGEFCFNGVTRGSVIRLCDANQIPIRLDFFRLDDVHAADEAFVTGTFGGLTPVRSVDGTVFPGGTPGPVTAKLRALYDALKDEQALYAQMRASP
jgi:branched-chain amino acid aminotransferase